jgi:hypothetical protein
MRDARPPARNPWSGTRDLAEWGEMVHQMQDAALRRVRQRLALRRDPRARLLRRRRRARKLTVTAGTGTGIFGGLAFAAWAPHLAGPLGAVPELLLDLTTAGFGGLTVFAGVGAIFAGLRYRRLRRTPLPEPAPEPVELPQQGSQAREPMHRLRDAEQSLHRALLQLTALGTDDGLVSDVRRTGQDAAVAMRRLADRLCVVEGGLPHAPESERSGLRGEIQRLRAELDEGVAGYGRLIAAAVRAVAASGDTERTQGMQDATDRLAGLAAAMRELGGEAADRENPA